MMKSILMVVSVSLGLAACSVSSSKFTAPTGKTGYVIRCKNAKACYREAHNKCPEGYTNITSPEGEQTELSGRKVVIECN